MSTSTIQIKRGTGSAVPSGLADGELAINLDSGRLYYGSGSNSVDSYTFTNVTASGDISASGTLDVTGNVNFDGDLDVDGTANFDDVDVDGDITIADQKNIIAESRLVMRGPRLTLQVTGSSPDAVNISSGSTVIAKFAGTADLVTGADHTRIVLGSANIVGQTSTVRVDGTLETTSHISASGDITASGGLTLGDGRVVGFSGNGRGTIGTNRLNLRGGETTTGNIQFLSGSTSIATMDCGPTGGTMNFGNAVIPSPVVTITGDLTTTSHITASGNISSSGNITARLNDNSGFILGSANALSADTNNVLYLGNNATWSQLRYGRLTATQHNFIGNITASGNISSSDTIITSTLSGGATGDQSGSLYLSGSLTFRDNEAEPVVSASTLFVKSLTTDNAPDKDLRFSNSGLTPAFAWVTLDDDGTSTSSEILFGVGSAVTSTVHNMVVVHDTSTNGTRIHSQIDGIYKVTGNFVFQGSSATTTMDIKVNGTTVHTTAPFVHGSVDPVERTQIYVGSVPSGSYITATADGTSLSYELGSVLMVERLA